MTSSPLKPKVSEPAALLRLMTQSCEKDMLRLLPISLTLLLLPGVFKNVTIEVIQAKQSKVIFTVHVTRQR